MWEEALQERLWRSWQTELRMSQQHPRSRERQEQPGLYEQETKENVRVPQDLNASSGSGLLQNHIAHTTEPSLSLCCNIPYKTLNDFKSFSKQG